MRRGRIARDRWRRLRRTDRAAPGRLPGFVIVGAMKAATTSVASWLRAHPQIYIPDEKELRFFHVQANWERGEAWYRSLFAAAPDDTLVGEATPAYMVHRSYIERMASVIPDALVLVQLRHPIDRAFSQYRHSVERGDETRSFTDVISDELAADPTDWRNSGRPLARSRYIDQLRTLADHYDRAHIHVGLFEDIVGRPHEHYAEICRFLGVDDTFVPANIGASEDPLLTDPQTAGRDRVTAEWTVSDDDRRRLLEHFRPYNERLAEWLGRDLGSWNA